MPSKGYKIIGFILTFIMAFLVVGNFQSYRYPKEIVSMQEMMLRQMEEHAVKISAEEATAGDVLAGFASDVESSLTESRYKRVSLFRLIGCFVGLIGISFLRKQRMIGLHLFLAGMLLVIFSAFYVYGFGFVGWVFNIGYLFFTFLVLLFYSTKRNLLQ